MSDTLAVDLPHARPGTALLLDAAGTLLHLAEPVAQTYARFARAHGTNIDAEQITARFPAAFARARPLRHGADDWRPYWQAVVTACTGDDSPALLDELIAHFARPAAWRLAEGAQACCLAVRERGMKVAVVSNWDHHLRPLLQTMGVLAWIDLLVVSGEERLEKPDPAIFARACARLGVAPEQAIHLGNDADDDILGARAAGCAPLLIGHDVADFADLARRLLAPTH